jgi:hypothetical protein
VDDRAKGGIPVSGTNDTRAPDEQTESPILASIRRLARQIEESKLDLICSPDDEQRITEALDRAQIGHMVNLYPSPFCGQGQIYVAKPTWGASL